MHTTNRGSCFEQRSKRGPPGRFLAPPNDSRNDESVAGGSTTTAISRGTPPRFARWCPNRPISASGRADVLVASRICAARDRSRTRRGDGVLSIDDGAWWGRSLVSWR